MGSETSKVAEALVKAQDRIAAIEANERQLREAVRFLARELEFRRSTREPAPAAWRYELESNPIASDAVREAGR